MWDPEQYARFAGERGRPFVELLNRVDLQSPRRVVDLGCGPGNLTAMLADRWPDATVVGIDSSPEMISAASSIDGVTFRLDDITAFRPDPDTDLLISNAALQWVPGHAELLRSWAAARRLDGLASAGQSGFTVARHTARLELRAPLVAVGRVRGPATGCRVVTSRVRVIADRGRLRPRRLGDHVHPCAGWCRSGPRMGSWHRPATRARGSVTGRRRGLRGRVCAAAAGNISRRPEWDALPVSADLLRRTKGVT